MRIKLTWHPGSKRWCKVIGKRLTKDRKGLAQAQFYFTPDREESETLALALAAEWKAMKKSWKTAHQPYLETLDELFPDVPHWYRRAGGTAISAEDVEQARVEFAEISDEEIAYEHREATLADIKTFYFAHRKTAEGIDFKSHSNKNHEIDVTNAMHHIDANLVAADLTETQIRTMRLSIMGKKSGIQSQTQRNYGMAFKAMLVWYWNESKLFRGKPIPNFNTEWTKYPKKRPAKPKHLPLDVLRLIFDMADARHRLYLLLMLNTGMAVTDIATVAASGFDLKNAKVTWKRHKNERLDRPSEVEIVSHLWPETMASVKKFLQRSGLAFRNTKGEPLAHVTPGRNQLNSAAKSLTKFFGKVRKKCKQDVSAKNFRQTGAQLIQEAGSYELSRVWLGRGFATEDQSYLKATYAKLDEAGKLVRQNVVETIAGI